MRLAPQPVPSDRQNRRRLAHSLASLDAQAMFDGGWLLPMGQEDAIRDLVAIYRQLPPVRMAQVNDHLTPGSGQPVTIRSATWGDRTYAYLVNDAPFATRVRVLGRRSGGLPARCAARPSLAGTAAPR